MHLDCVVWRFSLRGCAHVGWERVELRCGEVMYLY